MSNVREDKTIIVEKKIVDNKRYETILETVISALLEKGYNPKIQLAGYLLTGEPIYITSYKNARTMIQQVDRFELAEYIVSGLIDKVVEKQNG